jgi:hypothetical protein
MTMTRAEAARTLSLMITAKNAGTSWAEIARLNGYPNGPAAKKAAKEAARMTQAFLLEKEYGKS